MRRTLLTAGAVLLGAAGPAAARPADVTIVNTAANPVQITAASPLPVTPTGPVVVKGDSSGGPVDTRVTNTPTVRPVPELFQSTGAVISGNCSTTVFGAVPAGRTVVVTDVYATAAASTRPEIYLRLQLRSGGGFTGPTEMIPLTQYPLNSTFSGALAINQRFVPGSTTNGDISSAVVCVTAGSATTIAATFIVSGYLE